MPGCGRKRQGSVRSTRQRPERAAFAEASAYCRVLSHLALSAGPHSSKTKATITRCLTTAQAPKTLGPMAATRYVVVASCASTHTAAYRRHTQEDFYRKDNTVTERRHRCCYGSSSSSSSISSSPTARRLFAASNAARPRPRCMAADGHLSATHDARHV